jgi:hypothetical protein
VRRTSRVSGPLGLLLDAALVAAATAPPASAQAPAGDGVLSNERTLTYWAFAKERAQIRAEPSDDAASVGRLRLSTELGSPEVYVALRRRSGEGGTPWLQVRIPARPNGGLGWVPESSLGRLSANYMQLVITLGKRRAVLFQSGTRVWSAPVGIGKAGTPTPRGRFYVRQRLRLGNGGGPYGTFAFGTSAYSATLSDWPGGGVIGIHGTNQPGLIPGRVSHGCVRVRNSQIRDLRKLMGLGTPILIR